ncbi:MAG: OPT/YSL family transporter, partial [Candidatus Micrarchaeota archaeon]
ASMIQNLGMGVLLGSGVGFLILYMIPNAKKILLPMLSARGEYFKAAPVFSVIAFFVLFALGVHPIASLLAVAFVWIVAGVAARMTGETDIDPYEQFGIVSVVSIGLIFALLGLNLDYSSSFIIVAFVTIAAAVVGDIGFDYKSAKIIGTRAIDMVKVDIIAVIFAGIATPFVLELIRQSYSKELFTQTMPATQASLVAGSISGFAHPELFLTGFVLALLWETVWVRLLKRKSPMSAMAFGIGMFIGFALSIPFAIGGVIRWVVEKKRPAMVEAGMLACAGVMGGVGIGGFARGALIITGVAPSAGNADLLVGAFFAVVLAFGIGWAGFFRGKR